MPNRILKDSICTSPTIDSLSLAEEVFFYRLIVSCDDYGLMDARESVLRAKLYPLKIDTISNANVAEWLGRLANLGIVEIYEVAGRPYLHVTTWEKHQQMRAQRAKYPLPGQRHEADASRLSALALIEKQAISPDINGYQRITLAPVIQSDSDSDSDSETKPTLKPEEREESHDSSAALTRPPALNHAHFAAMLRTAKPNKAAILVDAVNAAYGVECREFARLGKLSTQFGAGEILKLVFTLAASWNGIDNPVNYIQGAAVAKANGRRNGPIVERLPENHQVGEPPDMTQAEPVSNAPIDAEVESDGLKEFRAHRERGRAARERLPAILALGTEPPEFGE